jgi:site-specific recombinase XerC
LDEVRDICVTGLARQKCGKTNKKLRMEIVGELKMVIDRIRVRKATYKAASTALVVSETGERLTLRALQGRFRTAREACRHLGERFPVPRFSRKGWHRQDRLDRRHPTGAEAVGHRSVTITEHYVRKRRGEKVETTR